jgi:DHA3 family macrolide efflux protein-like MFS transporter
MREQGWKNRTTRFLIAQAVSLMGSSIVQFAIIWYITLETSSGMMMMFTTFFSLVPMIIVSPFVGVLLDRFSRKSIIMISDTVIALVTLALFFAIVNGYTQWWLIFTAVTIRSIGSGVQLPAVLAVVPQLADKDHLMRVNGIYASINSFTAFLSPALAAMVLGAVGLGASLMVDVVTALIGVGITATVYFPPRDQEKGFTTSGIEDFKLGFAYMMSHTFIKRLFVFCGIVMFLLSSTHMIPLITERSFGGEFWKLASLESAYGLGAMIGGACLAWWGGFKNRMSTMLFATLCLGILMTLLGFAPFWYFMAVLFIWGLFGPMFDTPFYTALQERVEPDMHGRMFSFLQIVCASAIPLGMMIFGPLADIVSVETIYAVCGVLLVATTVYARYGLKLEHI